MRFLITGTAGFIGFSLARRLLADGHSVTGIDGMTPYYDITLKKDRHAILKQNPAFREHILMLSDIDSINQVADGANPEVIIHLAAQAGVRYSLEHPRAYIDANLVGTFNIMEIARTRAVGHFLFASTSSIYGANEVMPFDERERTDHPLTLYAATKKATEDMAHSYAHLWKIPTTAFRFFTVYGPWGRPDMALFKFIKAALAGDAIDVYGHGKMQRDFTFIDDLIESIARLIETPPVEGQPISVIDSISPAAPYRVVNIGGGQPVGLLDYIDEIEKSLGVKIKRNFMDMQKGDVPATVASALLLQQLIGFKPTTAVDVGIKAFIEWYRSYYSI